MSLWYTWRETKHLKIQFPWMISCEIPRYTYLDKYLGIIFFFKWVRILLRFPLIIPIMMVNNFLFSSVPGRISILVEQNSTVVRNCGSRNHKINLESFWTFFFHAFWSFFHAIWPSKINSKSYNHNNIYTS